MLHIPDESDHRSGVKPRDKPKVEAGVQFVQRFILAGLRHRTFFCLAEANAAIKERLELLNNRPVRKLPGTRKSRFEELDHPAMLPLSEPPYQYAQWKVARVHIDYHVDVEGHFYSVPYRLVREQVDVRYTSAMVECFYKGNRIASHPRTFVKGKHTTDPEHMPTSHREYAEWTPRASRYLGIPDRQGNGSGRGIHSLQKSLCGT